MTVKHPPRSILGVADEVIYQLRTSDKLSEALDATCDRNPDADNVRVRWLARRNAYEVTIVLDAERMQS